MESLISFMKQTEFSLGGCLLNEHFLKKAEETYELILIISSKTSDLRREEPEPSACQEVLKVSFRTRS